MMFRRRKIHLIILTVLMILFLSPSIKVKAEEGKVGIIYDTYNEFGSDENKLNSLVTLVLSAGKGVDIININSNPEASFDKYDTVIVLYNNSSELPKGFIENILKFKGKTIWIGKNFDKTLEDSENVNYIPNFSLKDESYSLNEKIIYKILTGKDQKQERVYLLIDKVYPFIDLNAFVDKIDFLYDQGIPFICSVMPVYENENFDAMKRFCEVLRYAQSKGGKIILHSSVFYGDGISGNDVKSKMDLAQGIYVKYGVYPLALDIPENFLYKEDYKSLIYSSNSLFIERDKQLNILDMRKYSIDKFDRVIQKIDIKDENRYKIPEITHNVAFSLNADLDLNSFKNEVNQILNRKISFSNAERLNSVIKLGKMELRSNNSDVLLNNKSVTEQNNITEIDSKAKSKNEAIDISNVYGQIIKITTLVSVIFLVIVIISRKIDREKFFNYRG